MEKTLFDNSYVATQAKEADLQKLPTEYSVSQISQKLKNFVERNFTNIRVRGELSRVTVAKSGHMYSSLKDENATLDIICWRGNLQNLAVRPEEGLEVICTGRLTTYAGRSNYQMIIDKMELAGEGALLKMLEERKRKLAAEGLFASERKKQIPFIPNIIGVITSPTGAVIRDIMHRISERFPSKVILYPVQVQGEGAAKQVVHALEDFNKIDKNNKLRPDVIIVARGGGSLEDLMPFNDENLVRAVAKSEIPIISAIGHETDTCLIDYAADLRAPTPTGAAEKAVPVKEDILNNIDMLGLRARKSLQNRVSHLKTKLDGLKRGLGDPNKLLENSMQNLDQISIRLDLSLKNWLAIRQAYLQQLKSNLSANNILLKISNYQRQLLSLDDRCNIAIRQKIKTSKQNLYHLSSMLDTLSFKKVLERGFVLVKDKKTGKTVKRAKNIITGDNLNLRFYDENIEVTVKDKK